MEATPTVFKTINVSSGRLCFGGLHNIWNGASAPAVQGLPHIRLKPFATGTVKVNRIEYNVTARNGTWNAFQLVDIASSRVVAWFLAHSDVDPESEIDRILSVSGSPYEYDSGSAMNDDKTEAAGVFVINRYDWGWYDDRSKDEVGDDVQEAENDYLSNGNSLGVVDFAEAKSFVSRWKTQRPSRREWSGGGAWLLCPGGEYMFGRFGFDDEHFAARSFVFFSTYTQFTRTVFAGTDRTLRKEETDEERFDRRMREGCDFSGLEEVRKMAKKQEDPSIPQFYPLPPSVAECFGPHDLSDHILRAQDINALHVHRVPPTDPRLRGLPPKRIGEFIEPWIEPLYDVTNEMLLGYLQRRVVPHMANKSLAEAAEALFPPEKRTGSDSGDAFYFPNFMNPNEEGIPDFDYAFVSGRIKSFLSRFEDDSVVFDPECVAGITRVVARMFVEVFELANNCSGDNGRKHIMPCDIRLGVYNWEELLRCLQYSRVFWEGRDCTIPLTE